MKRLLIALSLTGLPWLASAGNLHLAPAAGNHVAVLQGDIQVFVDAMHNRLVESDAERVRVDGKGIRKVRQQINNFTLAHFEYTYTEDGIEKTLVAHGRSGKPLETILDDAKFTADRHLRTGSGTSSGAASDSASGSAGAGESRNGPREDYQLTPEEVQRDIQEARLFPPDTVGRRGIAYRDVRVPRIPEDESLFKHRTTDLPSDPSRGTETLPTELRGNHANDAELMNVRYYGREIDAGRLPAGGKLKGVVSQTPCASCQSNLLQFAKHYDIDVDIRYLVEPAASGRPYNPPDEPYPEPTDEEIRSSRDASKEFNLFRKNYARSQLHQSISHWNKRPVTSWSSAPHARSVEAEDPFVNAEVCE